MARFATAVEATDKDGNSVDLSASAAASASQDNKAFATIKPDYYYAVVTGVESGHYRGKWGTFVNEAVQDGKWNYEKIVPKFTLLNENGSQINRQDYTLGVYENGKFVRPDGKAQSPIMLAAQFLLQSLGLFKSDPDNPAKFKLEVNFDLVKDRVVRVRTGIAGYSKTPRLNLDSNQFAQLMIAIHGNDKYTFEDINTLVGHFNEMNADELTKVLDKVSDVYNKPNASDIIAARATNADDAALKTKNVILSVYAVPEKDAAEHEWFYDQATGSVFTTAAAWEEYIVADEEDRNYVEPNM